MSPKQIAILSTGNELVVGQLLNTDAQFAAQRLDEYGIAIGLHMTVSDTESDIVLAIQFLLNKHDALLITGGLGPTSDDRTRFALAKALDQSLEFHEPSWQRISTRLKNYNLPPIENNKQQALFPKGATVLKNDNGTADACSLTHNGKQIYMLPGPPEEFQPLFNDNVLPDLIANGFSKPLFKGSWLLLNVSEGHIANQLDFLVDSKEVELGYRVHYPYLEIKLRAIDEALYEQWAKRIQPVIHDHVVSTQKEPASLQLKRWLNTAKLSISMVDEATGGLLEQTLASPENHHCLHFQRNPAETSVNLSVTIRGLENFWQGVSQFLFAQLCVSIFDGKETITVSEKVATHTRNVRLYAMENACWILLNYLRDHHA